VHSLYLALRSASCALYQSILFAPASQPVSSVVASKTSQSSPVFISSPFRELIATAVIDQQRALTNEAGTVKNNGRYERKAEVHKPCVYRWEQVRMSLPFES